MKEKMIQIMGLHADVSADDILVAKFFDLDSEKMLDVKIDVLTKLKNGIPPKDIPEYYSILELYPEDDALWD
jgi:hypothetical protein